MRKEKESDKSMIQENKLIITFDFENLINLPKAEDGSFLYKRKQNLYNLTTKRHINKDIVQFGPH